MFNWVARLVLNGINYIFRDIGSVRFDEEQELTTEEKELARSNIGLSDEGAVRYDVSQSLTIEEQETARNNIGVTDITGAVRYDESQTLTEEQKATARNNIGAGTGGGGGDVASVNGKTGVVVLDATDVQAIPEPAVVQENQVVVYKYDHVNNEWYTSTEVILNAEPKDSTMTQPVGIDANKRLWTAPGSGGGGGGAVSSVNGQTGAVVLDADDVGAIGLPAAGIPNYPLVYKYDAINDEWYTTCEMIINPEAKDNTMTQPVGIDSNKKLWAKPNVTPSAKTSGMTQEVGIDSVFGTLWTYPGSGGGGAAGHVIDTIWTNSNTEYSTFAETSIPFTDAGYDFFMILYKPRNNLAWAMPICTVSKDYKTTMLMFYGWSGTDPASISVFIREVTFGTNSITIKNAFVADGTQANYALIPLKIYGVRSAT